MTNKNLSSTEIGRAQLKMEKLNYRFELSHFCCSYKFLDLIFPDA